MATINDANTIASGIKTVIESSDLDAKVVDHDPEYIVENSAKEDTLIRDSDGRIHCWFIDTGVPEVIYLCSNEQEMEYPVELTAYFGLSEGDDSIDTFRKNVDNVNLVLAAARTLSGAVEDSRVIDQNNVDNYFLADVRCHRATISMRVTTRNVNVTYT